jgi:endonuclease G
MPANRPASALIGAAVVIFLILVIVLVLCNRQRRHVENESSPNIPSLEIPASSPGIQLLSRRGFTLGYRNEAAQAAWSAYLLTADEVAHADQPRGSFHIDPATENSADQRDYEGSGLDRGHLAPAEDMAYSKKSAYDCFYYSNMSPQVPAFNRGVWRRLEELFRFWAMQYDSIYIVTGPVLEQGLPAIGMHQVLVPRRFYKVALVYGHGGMQAIGFLLNNQASPASLNSFAVSVDSIESVTGLDFFPQLPDEQEGPLERSITVDAWAWRKTGAPKN